jgi:hypothetical protein
MASSAPSFAAPARTGLGLTPGSTSGLGMKLATRFPGLDPNAFSQAVMPPDWALSDSMAAVKNGVFGGQKNTQSPDVLQGLGKLYEGIKGNLGYQYGGAGGASPGGMGSFNMPARVELPNPRPDAMLALKQLLGG